jgi:malate/lactate dehydrogenase
MDVTFRVAVVGSGCTAAAFADALRTLPVRTTVVDPADAAFVRADVVVLATGSFALPDDGLIAAAARNAPSVAWVVRRLDEAVPDAVLLIASPPVALTTRIAIDVSTREGARIIGVSSDVPTQAVSVAAVVASIIADDDAVHDVCAGAPRAYGVGDVVLALPCRIGRRGIQERLVVARDPQAQLGLAVTAATLRAAYETLVGGAAVG